MRALLLTLLVAWPAVTAAARPKAACRPVGLKARVDVQLAEDSTLGDLVRAVTAVTCQKIDVDPAFARLRLREPIAGGPMLVIDAVTLFAGAVHDLDLTIVRRGGALEIVRPRPRRAAGGGEGDAKDPFAAPRRSAADPKIDAALERLVVRQEDTRFVLDRTALETVLGDPATLGRSVRIVPSMKDGKATGFKLYAIRPGSLFARLGFQNGDTLNSVNGHELTSPDKALEAYTSVKQASRIIVVVTRRGQPLTLEYSIR